METSLGNRSVAFSFESAFIFVSEWKFWDQQETVSWASCDLDEAFFKPRQSLLGFCGRDPGETRLDLILSLSSVQFWTSGSSEHYLALLRTTFLSSTHKSQLFRVLLQPHWEPVGVDLRRAHQRSEEPSERNWDWDWEIGRGNTYPGGSKTFASHRQRHENAELSEDGPQNITTHTSLDTQSATITLRVTCLFLSSLFVTQDSDARSKWRKQNLDDCSQMGCLCCWSVFVFTWINSGGSRGAGAPSLENIFATLCCAAGIVFQLLLFYVFPLTPQNKCCLPMWSQGGQVAGGDLGRVLDQSWVRWRFLEWSIKFQVTLPLPSPHKC